MKKVELLNDSQYNSPENQNRDNAIIGYISVNEEKLIKNSNKMYPKNK